MRAFSEICKIVIDSGSTVSKSPFYCLTVSSSTQFAALRLQYLKVNGMVLQAVYFSIIFVFAPVNRGGVQCVQ